MGNRINGPGDQAFQRLRQQIVDKLQQVSVDTIQGGRGDSSLDNSEVMKFIQARQAQNGVERVPWIMTTTEWQTGSPARALVWAANPSDVQWSMPQRTAHTKNMVGTVLHVWPDPRRGTFFDEYRLSMNFQSGNLLPVNASFSGDVPVVGPANWVPSGGIANFYDFMQLVDAPKLTTENPPRANLVYIQYTSNLFPKLTLMGMFESDGITFRDDSQNPNQVSSWSATFLVYDTYPKLSDNQSGQQNNAALLEMWKTEKIRKGRLDF
jgi:hypothetical protein